MKCPNCGGNISLEDRFCPFCGAPNTLAMQHAQDMAEYREDYEQTKQEVYAGQKRLSAVVVRVVVLVALIIACSVVLTLLDNGIYSIRRDRKAREAEKNIVEYTAVMDQYLAEGDYLEFHSFCEEHNLRFLDAYSKYEPAIAAANDYTYCITYLLTAEFPGPYDDRARYIGYMADSLDSFYKDRMDDFYGDAEDEKETRAIYEKAHDGMQTQLERALVTYMGLTKEQAESLPTLSKAKRTVLIEEAANGETKQE